MKIYILIILILSACRTIKPMVDNRDNNDLFVHFGFFILVIIAIVFFVNL